MSDGQPPRYGRHPTGSLDRAIEDAYVAIGVVRDGRFAFANRALCNLLRVESAVDVEVATLVPNIMLVDALAAQQPRDDEGNFELRFEEGASAVAHVRTCATTLDGSPATLLLATDVTERRRLEAHLINSNRMASLGSLAAGIAHRVNNPLTTVLLNLTSLIRDLDGIESKELADKTLGHANAARKAAERVRSAMLDLRTFSRWTDEHRAIDVRSILDAVTGLASYAADPATEIVVDYQSVPMVEADEAHLGQVLLTLLKVALLAGSDGRVSQIVVSTYGNEVGNAVVDIGEVAGSPRDGHEFTKVLNTGLGDFTDFDLSISRSVIASLGGTLSQSLASAATFRVELPGLDTTDSLNRSQGRVLVVDGNAQAASAQVKRFARACSVRVVGRGARALDILRHDSNFDLILVDAANTGVSGSEFIDELRGCRPGVENRVVFTSDGQPCAEADMLAARGTTIFRKPLTVDQFDELMSRRNK